MHTRPLPSPNILGRKKPGESGRSQLEHTMKMRTSEGIADGEMQGRTVHEASDIVVALLTRIIRFV